LAIFIIYLSICLSIYLSLRMLITQMQLMFILFIDNFMILSPYIALFLLHSVADTPLT